MNNCEECGWPEPCDCEPERSAGSLERAGSAATCEWETVAPAKICGEPAAYEDINGKKFCERHGHHLVKRYPTTMTKLEVPPNESSSATAPIDEN